MCQVSKWPQKWAACSQAIHIFILELNFDEMFTSLTNDMIFPLFLVLSVPCLAQRNIIIFRVNTKIDFRIREFATEFLPTYIPSAAVIYYANNSNGIPKMI